MERGNAFAWLAALLTLGIVVLAVCIGLFADTFGKWDMAPSMHREWYQSNCTIEGHILFAMETTFGPVDSPTIIFIYRPIFNVSYREEPSGLWIPGAAAATNYGAQFDTNSTVLDIVERYPVGSEVPCFVPPDPVSVAEVGAETAVLVILRFDEARVDAIFRTYKIYLSLSIITLLLGLGLVTGAGVALLRLLGRCGGTLSDARSYAAI